MAITLDDQAAKSATPAKPPRVSTRRAEIDCEVSPGAGNAVNLVTDHVRPTWSLTKRILFPLCPLLKNEVAKRAEPLQSVDHQPVVVRVRRHVEHGQRDPEQDGLDQAALLSARPDVAGPLEVGREIYFAPPNALHHHVHRRLPRGVP